MKRRPNEVLARGWCSRSTCRSQDRVDERRKPAALPHSGTRTAWRRPPFPRSSWAAEVEDPPGNSNTTAWWWWRNYSSRASLKPWLVMVEQLEGRSKMACEWIERGRCSTLPFIGVRGTPRGWAHQPMVAAPTSPSWWGWTLHSHPLTLHFFSGHSTQENPRVFLYFK